MPDSTSLFCVRLPLPPSVNVLHITSRSSKRPILSPEVRKFNAEARAILRAQLRLTPWAGPWPDGYAITLRFFYESAKQMKASDWDNRIKIVQDRVCEALRIDDSLIRDGRAIKCGVAPLDAYVDVEVAPYAG